MASTDVILWSESVKKHRNFPYAYKYVTELDIGGALLANVKCDDAPYVDGHHHRQSK